VRDRGAQPPLHSNWDPATLHSQDALHFVHAEHDGQGVVRGWGAPARTLSTLRRRPLPPERVLVEELDTAQPNRECAGRHLLVVLEIV